MEHNAETRLSDLSPEEKRGIFFDLLQSPGWIVLSNEVREGIADDDQNRRGMKEILDIRYSQGHTDALVDIIENPGKWIQQAIDEIEERKEQV